MWQTSEAHSQDLFARVGLAAPQLNSLISNRSAIDANQARGAVALAPRLSVPSAFITLCETVILHRDPDRFTMLYRYLWRMQQEPGLHSDPLDVDWLRLQQMARAVRRDQPKMKAFVRFRRLD